MIDPGATHNFASLEKVKELNLAITESGEFGVSLGNGKQLGAREFARIRCCSWMVEW